MPLFGAILMFSFIFFGLLFKYWFISLPLTVATCYLLLKWKRKMSEI